MSAVRRLVWLFAFAALCRGGAIAAEPESGALTVVLDDLLTLSVPPDMTREQRTLGPRGQMLTLADGGDVIVVIVYRRDGVAPPSPAAALEAHASALERAFAPTARRALKLRALGRERAGFGFTFAHESVEREASLLAFEARGRTVVASAMLAPGSPNGAAFAAILQAMRVK